MTPFLDVFLCKTMRFLGQAFLPGWCNLCGRPTVFSIRSENLREDVRCLWCGSFNRKRQVQYVLGQEMRASPRPPAEVTLWNTECTGSLHERLRERFGDRYVASEYFGPEVPPGGFVGGLRHEDMRRTSFAPESFDFVVSCDVLEHVPGPEQALAEARRVLRPGGKLVFTVPFVEGMPRTDVYARLREDGSTEHLKEPTYHGSPTRARGILVYQIFGEDLAVMCRTAGLALRKVKFRKPLLGIVGTNALVFVAEKPPEQPAGEGGA